GSTSSAWSRQLRVGGRGASMGRIGQRSWKAPTKRMAPVAAGMSSPPPPLCFDPGVRATAELSPSSPGVVPRLANGRPRTKPGSGLTDSVVGGVVLEAEEMRERLVVPEELLSTGGGAPGPLGAGAVGFGVPGGGSGTVTLESSVGGDGAVVDESPPAPLRT